MRIPTAYYFIDGNPILPAGALYIEVRNTSDTSNLGINFTGTTTGIPIVLTPGEIRIFEPIGAQGYAGFKLDDGNGNKISPGAYLILIF